MVLSFEASVRGVGVSFALVALVTNLLVTPLLLDSWEQGMMRNAPHRQLQGGDGGGGGGGDGGGRGGDDGHPCFKTVCPESRVEAGSTNFQEAQEHCETAGATVCTPEQWEGLAGFSLSGCPDKPMVGQSTAFLDSDRCADGQLEIIKNNCMDWDNDCCIGEEDDDHDHDGDGDHDHDEHEHEEEEPEEEAACADGYEVEQLPGQGGYCGTADASPTFKCVPADGSATEDAPICVDEGTQTNKVVCCANHACMETRGEQGAQDDFDCCTLQGEGSCKDGCASKRAARYPALPTRPPTRPPARPPALPQPQPQPQLTRVHAAAVRSINSLVLLFRSFRHVLGELDF
jgi:hypothetical protein